jgi:uncharacterized OB-fold protein
MTSLLAQQPGTPAPQPGRLSQPYWDGCREGELRFQRCDVCGTIPTRPSAICPHCHGRALSWERSAGAGSLYSWTIVWRPQHPAFVVPYAPAIIELDEGAFLMSAMIGCDDTDLAAGLRVEVEFHPASDTITLPYFRPSAGGAAS